MSRLNRPWWPVSPARKRALQKQGIPCRWDSAQERYVRENPTTRYQVTVNGHPVGYCTHLRINPRKRNPTKLQTLKALLEASCKAKRTIFFTF